MDQSGQSHNPPRVTIVNQYYAPDIASTGQLLHELAHELRDHGFDVAVVSAKPNYGPPETWVECPRKETNQGIRIRRVRCTRFSKDKMLGRLSNIFTFLASLSFRMLISPRDRVYLYVTNPPFLGVIGAFTSLFRRHRYVMLLHDAYPQIVVWMGKMTGGGFIEKTWHRFNRFMYRRASQVIVLCDAAKKLVCEDYGIPPDRVHEIPNWADGEKLSPMPKAESEFARTHGLIEPFTLLYSGNLGLYYDFETILGAAEALRDEPFRLVFIGSGGKRDWLEEQIKLRKLSNTLLLPYQPFEKLRDSLNACDASLVTIAEGIEGISFPSKLYSSLAVGKPILALSEDWSEMKTIVERSQVGLWAPVGDTEATIKCLRKLMGDREFCREAGANARALFQTRYTRQASGREYARVLRAAQ